MTIAPHKIYLGMPGHGQCTEAAARGLWRASRDMDRVWVEYAAGSLLATNFNRLWCNALNLARRGEPVKYFAMLHDDVGPQDWWLDALVDELELEQLDVLGVVVPIKDPRGMTSIALDSGDPWRPLCRLAMSEVMRLPATFTSQDLGHPLLLNTGCWVCRFDLSWARRAYFTINDRIVIDEASGEFRVEVEPEDWFFSRGCHELGLKLGATRKIVATHRGKVDVCNQSPWGSNTFDREYTPASLIPTVDRDGFCFPHDVDGWLLYEEGKALYELARGKRVLEIGSYCGKSTICLAQTARHVVSVDPHDGRGTPQPKDTFATFRDNLARYGVAEIVDTRRAVASKVGLEAEPGFDLVFIDGAHDFASVDADIAWSRERLAAGGLLTFHDYRRRPGEHDGGWDPGVTQAVDALLAAGGQLLMTRGTLAVVRPPALTRMEVIHG